MRLRIKSVAISTPLLLLGVSGVLHAQTATDTAPRTSSTAEASEEVSLETVLIVAQREARTSKGATGLDMSLADTQQSVTVLDRDTLDTFDFDEINDVLSLTTGVNVEAVETDRTYYNARGFDILSMQVDGVGMPFNDLVIGAQASYEINEHFKLNANLDNVTDKKHLTSLYWDQAFYGAPRHINVSASWKY